MSSNSNTFINVPAPWHLWLIGGLMAIWNGFASFDFMATVLRFEPWLSQLPDDVVAHYLAAPVWMFAMWGIGAVGGFISALLLLMRNRLAVPIFAASLLAAVIAQVYAVGNPPPGDSSGLVLAVVIIAIASLVLLYAMWMKRRGVLR